MMDSARDKESLEKLLKLARSDADMLRIDLVDVEKARSGAERALLNLEQAAKTEEAAGVAAPGDLAAYLEGVRARRHNLRTTLMTLTNAEENVRAQLESAFIEIKKLEHLMEAQARRLNKTHRRRDLSAMDEIASIAKRKA